MLVLKPNDNLTKNFKLKEFCVSQDHPEVVKSLYVTAGRFEENLFYLSCLLLQPIRDEFGPIHISSGYRDKTLNDLVGGVSTSMHRKGKAADIYTDDKNVLEEIFEFIKTALAGRFGELLLYRKKDGTPRFIHVALPELDRAVIIKS